VWTWLSGWSKNARMKHLILKTFDLSLDVIHLPAMVYSRRKDKSPAGLKKRLKLPI
jgi:hypothetical protein